MKRRATFIDEANVDFAFSRPSSLTLALLSIRSLKNDSHHVLIDGDTPAYVREKTFEVLNIMASGGGYVAGASHDSILEETPVENVLAMFDAVEEFSAATTMHT